MPQMWFAIQFRSALLVVIALRAVSRGAKPRDPVVLPIVHGKAAQDRFALRVATTPMATDLLGAHSERSSPRLGKIFDAVQPGRAPLASAAR